MKLILISMNLEKTCFDTEAKLNQEMACFDLGLLLIIIADVQWFDCTVHHANKSHPSTTVERNFCTVATATND